MVFLLCFAARISLIRSLQIEATEGRDEASILPEDGDIYCLVAQMVGDAEAGIQEERDDREKQGESELINFTGDILPLRTRSFTLG